MNHRRRAKLSRLMVKIDALMPPLGRLREDVDAVLTAEFEDRQRSSDDAVDQLQAACQAMIEAERKLASAVLALDNIEEP
jgi:hypothetical protein